MSHASTPSERRFMAGDVRTPIARRSRATTRACAASISSGAQPGAAQAAGEVVAADRATGAPQAARRRLDRGQDGAHARVAAVAETGPRPGAEAPRAGSAGVG